MKLWAVVFMLSVFGAHPGVCFAGDQDPTDWFKIVAIFGPVIGIIIGALGSWLQQWYSLRHSDKKRFHELRTEVYSKYLYTTNKIILDFLEGRRNNSDLENLLHLGVQISLIASSDVRTHLFNINTTIKQISDNLATVGENQQVYNQHVVNFIASVRKELDVKN